MEVQAVVALFLVCFPLSVCLWSMLLVSAGVVHSVPAMPWELRLAARVTGADKDQGPSPMEVPAGALLLVFVNLPAPLILVGPYGAISSVAAVAYVVVQLLWLARIRRAVRWINRQQP